MRRLFIFLSCVTLIALVLAWVADKQGTVTLSLLGYTVRASLFVAVIALALIVTASLLVIQFIRFLFHGPEAFRMFLRVRRKDRGLDAVARGLVAVGAWDVRQAMRATKTAETYLGQTPLTLLLRSQAAQLTGDRDKARASFEAMLENPQTRLLGLRGLFVEAQRAGNAKEASLYAATAAQMKADLPWASNALLITQGHAGKWDAAMSTIKDRLRHRLIDRAEAKQQRAVALTAKAKSLLQDNRAEAKTIAMEAHTVDPALAPAALLAATLFAESQDFKQAARILERNWKIAPHPHTAQYYIHMHSTESGRDRMKRARSLLRIHPNHPESLIAFASAAAEARDFALARSTLKPLLDNQPSQRVCLIMAKFAEVEDNDIGEMRGWLDKALRAPRDAQWIGDGQVLSEWAPIAPVSGELGGVKWRIPHDEPQGLVLLQEQMPNIPAPQIASTPRTAKTAQMTESPAPVTLTPAALAAKAAQQTPFVPDDPGPADDDDSPDEAAGSRFQ